MSPARTRGDARPASTVAIPAARARRGSRPPPRRSRPGADRGARRASGPRPGQVHDDPVAVETEQRRRGPRSAAVRPRGARARGRRRSASPDGAGDSAVAGHDDRGLLARDRGDRVAEIRGVVQLDVRDRGDAAVPGVGGVQAAAEPHLDDREVHALVREPPEREGREELELGGFAVGPRDPLDSRGRLVHEPGERRGRDGHAGDLQPLAVRDEVRLGGLARAEPGLAQDAPDEREDAPLAVRAADEGAADRTVPGCRARGGGRACGPGPAGRRTGRDAGPRRSRRGM